MGVLSETNIWNKKKRTRRTERSAVRMTVYRAKSVEFSCRHQFRMENIPEKYSLTTKISNM